MNTAIFPGSFDPLQTGTWTLLKGRRPYTTSVIVAVLQNSSKSYMFSVEERMEMLRKSCMRLAHALRSPASKALLVDFARSRGCRIILRGLRAVTDFEYEFTMALMNKKLAPEIETLFIVTSAENQFISSSSIKEIAHFGGPVEDMVPQPVASKLGKR
ncbi:MAG: pantetheine-phosphate adenylyltransferase [Anaerotruncus sp.]|nr:pantetheine-phosphate adenylyltransferase [Anaerotruncus sp.]